MRSGFDSFIALGPRLFAVPLAVMGVLQLMNPWPFADTMPSVIPLRVWVAYLSGCTLVAAAACLLIGRLEKRAAIVLAVYFILLAALVHNPAMFQNNPDVIAHFIKDLALAGGALIYIGKGNH